MSAIQWLSGKGYLGIEIWHCLIAVQMLQRKNSLRCVHRERWDTAAAVSLCGRMALCGPWAIPEISPVRPETNTGSAVAFAHQLRVGGSSKCQMVFVDEKSRRASLEPLPFPVWRKHSSLPKRRLAGKPSHHTWKTSSLSSHSLLSPTGGLCSWMSEWVCVRLVWVSLCRQYKVYVEMGCETHFIKKTVYMEALVCVCVRLWKSPAVSSLTGT